MILSTAQVASTADRQLGAYIAAMRKAKGLHAKDVCRLAGITQTYMSQIERGKKRCSTIFLGKLCELLDLDIYEVMIRSGRIPENVQFYLRNHPSGVVLLHRLMKYNLSDKSIQLLIRHLDTLADQAAARAARRAEMARHGIGHDAQAGRPPTTADAPRGRVVADEDGDGEDQDEGRGEGEDGDEGRQEGEDGEDGDEGRGEGDGDEEGEEDQDGDAILSLGKISFT